MTTITIDGPAGSGKSTIARAVAEQLGFEHLDTGALYRGVTLLVEQGVVTLAETDIEGLDVDTFAFRDGRLHIAGTDVEDDIRGAAVTAAVSDVAAHPAVRNALTPLQRAVAANSDVVAEGRDMGTTIFPDAELKIFLTADPAERARRRLAQQGRDAEDKTALSDEILRLKERDHTDANREVSPLAKARDAVEIDTTEMTEGDVVEAIVGHLKEAEADLGGLPRIVIVGRPNVGKSTLVNRIIGRREAITEEKPGVTRDATEHEAEHEGQGYIVIDTGGWEPKADTMSSRIADVAERAVGRADHLVLVIDAATGVTEHDIRFSKRLRKLAGDTPVTVVANKADNPSRERDVWDAETLGWGEAYPISAKHGHGIRDLRDRLIDALPSSGRGHRRGGLLRVAIVGRPNAGKSSLLNTMAGAEVSMVDEVAHTTRDSVDTVLTLGEREVVLVDTAGLRRRFRSGEETEKYAADRTRDALTDADVALLVIDGSEAITEQDQKLANLVFESRCGVVLVINKWDEVDAVRKKDLERELERLLRFATWVPRVNISAKTGRGVGRIAVYVDAVARSLETRVTTGQLNRWMAEITDRVAPPPTSGRDVRLKYMTQDAESPGSFLVFANRPVDQSYVRYIENQLRATYGFEGVPVQVEVRSS